ncbi:spore germination protein [Bacillaceae bacterium Marseille-Q3522]|nr:spore germination protein [Bacillaceae bacterium Marseille-Q3522]
MKERVGLGTSFDLGVRKMDILQKEIHLYYVNGLCDTQYIIEILEPLVMIHTKEKMSDKLFSILKKRLTHQSVEEIKTMDELVDRVLSGLIVIVTGEEQKGIAVDVRNYPGRDPQEPDTEKVVRGSRDGFVENIIINSALTRRRIRDERLRVELLQIGERSKTDVAICYLKDVADPDLINIVKQELQAIQIDGLTMAEKTIEEFLLKQGYNPYPLVRYTERSDVAATHILEGHVCIFVDTSPSVIITPATYFHHLQHAEEFRQSPAVGTLIRWVRFLGVLISLFLLPFWMLIVIEPSLLPERLAFVGPNEQSNIPVFIQIFIADIGIDFLRIAAIHTPTPLSTAMGLIAAVLIGQIAIDVGLFVPEIILYVSFAAIGTFTTPSYELSAANKIVRFLLLLLVVIFHLPGFVIGSTCYILFLAHTRSLNTPYLWPFIPFHPAAFSHIIVRRTVPGTKLRPSIVHPRNRYKQP